MKKDKNIEDVDEKLQKLEVLSDIYNDIAKKDYRNKKELAIAKLKMNLVKKELVLVTYLLDREIKEFTP